MRVFLLLLVLGVGPGALGQSGSAWADSLAAYWAHMEQEFADPAHSPLTDSDRVSFHGLPRFAADSAYRVVARFKPARRPKRFGMRTTTDRVPIYRDMGTLSFSLQGRECVLHVYQNVALVEQEPYRDHLFVPFTDLTNGEETYGGGRYLDLKGPLGGTVEIDLNRAYNPYCAYNARYSCPVPPVENHVDLRVEAGVLKHHD